MKGEYLLQAVWSGEVWLCADNQSSPLVESLRILLPRPVIHLVSVSIGARPFATYGGAIVERNLTVADVLEQELDIDVADDDIILIEPKSFVEGRQCTEAELGRHLGALLVYLVGANRLHLNEIDATGIRDADSETRVRLSKALPDLATHLN